MYTGIFNMAAKVELGICKFLRSNTNYLHQNLRMYGEKVANVPSYELAWTDGERVWLSPVDFNSNCREASCITAKEPCLVGEFGGLVFGVSCSALTKETNGYYIAVILKEKVVVLFRKIGGAVVKVVKEYFTECVPQGCEWHPCLPILAVLSKTSAVLLCFSDQEEFECASIPIQTSYRNLQTCAWSNNGRSLAVAVEDSLCIFSWTDFDKPDQFSFVQWSSLELTGKIKCIVPWQMFSFIIAKELPLEKLCGNSANDGDMFEIENISHTHQNGQDSCGVSTCNKSGYEDADFAILTQRADRDFTSLLKLKLRKQQCKAQASLAEVIVICYKDPKPRAICRTSIEGLISPDLMLFQPVANTVVVGSHCCSKLHCYTLLPCNLNGKTEFKAKEILELDPNTKPKGLCLIPGQTDSFLALLGKSKELSNMTAFPPSAPTEQYDVSLQCFNAFLNGGNAMKSLEKSDEQERFDQCSNKGAVLDDGGATSVATYTGHSPSLRLPDGSVFKGGIRALETEKTSLISELELTNVSDLHGNARQILQDIAGDHSSCTRHIQEVKTTMMVALSQINENLSKLEKRMDGIHSNKDEDNKHNLYPLPDNAEFVSVVWTDELTGAIEQENFLLDKGRLKLKTIQKAFSASLVRMSIGDVPCIVASGEGGFIPVRFLSGSTVQMSGHSKHQQSSE